MIMKSRLGPVSYKFILLVVQTERLTIIPQS